MQGVSSNTGKSGGGWTGGPSHGYLPSHDDQGRAKAAALQGSANEQGSSSRATPETSTAAAAATRRLSIPMPGANGDILIAMEEEEVPTTDCYFPPGQDNGEDDKDTFVDKGSAAALDAPPDVASPSTPAAAATGVGSSMASVKRTNKARPTVTVHSPPSSIIVGSGPSSSPVLVNAGTRPGNNTNAPNAVSGTLGGVSSLLPAANTTTTIGAAAAAGTAGGTTRDSGSSPSAGNALTTVAGVGGGGNTPGQATRPPDMANTSPSPHLNTPVLRRPNAGKAGTNTSASPPQYSRLNASEAAPGVVYRAALTVRALAMDPEQPVLWAAVGDDPLAALRIDGCELSHSKSVKDIEQVHCMAVVRIAEDQGTTFKSASASPRGGLSTPKTASPKTGRRSKKSGRRSTSTRKSGKLGAAAGALIPIRNADGDDEDDSDSNGEDSGGTASPSGARDKLSYTNYLWCGLSRGQMAVVNMATLEHQVIHNAHTQTINRIWYWEARDKVWTAGREKGVHVWDPQRRVILKKRNIAAILTDATYAEAEDKVFAVADDPCVRVFEPGGENVNVPKGQENRIKMKSDASVIQYHRNSGLVWVGLARGSVLMNPATMDVERTLPFTFSAILFEGEHAIIAGQEVPNGESRLMVLDVSSPREPFVIAYTKFANPLLLGIHVIPNTRFAVAAQDDPKKGVVVAIFVYVGTASLTHAAASASRYPEQRTEKVIRAPTTGAVPSSPAQLAQPPLITAAPLSSDTGSPLPGTESNALVPHVGSSNRSMIPYNNTNSGAVVMVDRTSLHRATVVKHAPESRTDRKFNVEADHSTLVEAIGPEAQEIKSALKVLVKTADEVRQSLVQQRSAEATLADFSQLLRSRQQWLVEQGPITNLPALTPPATERVNRDYVTPEGKTIATATEQLQLMYAKVQAKLHQLQQQQHPSPIAARLSVANSTAPTRLSPSLSSPPGVDYGSSGVAEMSGQSHLYGSGEQRAPSPSEGDATNNNSYASTTNNIISNNAMPGYTGIPPATAVGVNDAVLPPWASQLAATLQRERVLHEQQMSALQLKVERLTERNAALSNAFARLQAHVAALGQQSLSAFEMDSEDSTGVIDAEVFGSATLRVRDQQRHMLSVLSSQQEASMSLFNQLGSSKYHKPKYVRHATEVLLKAIDELVRLTHVKMSLSRETEAQGRSTVVRQSSSAVLGNTMSDERGGNVEVRRSLTQAQRYPTSFSPSPSSPLASYQPPHQQAPHDITADGTGRAEKLAISPRSRSEEVDDEGTNTLVDRPITSFRGACAMVEAELNNLRAVNTEAMSLWARLQNTPPQGSTTTNTTTSTNTMQDEEVTESSVKSVDGGLLLSLAPSNDTGASPTLLHLMSARVLQAVCWAECGQTVLRELTNASGLENPFVAGCVHNTLVSARTIGAGGVDGEEEWWRQGPLEVLDYESAQERADVLLTVRQLATSSGMEIARTARVRETLQARCRASKECHALHRDSEFMLHRLPGALCWSQAALRLLFDFLESTDHLLTSVSAARKDGAENKKEKKPRSSNKAPATAGPASPPPHDMATRTASAVGVAMTHWALFLLNLRANLLAVHHATRLYHAWCWGPAPMSAAHSTKSSRATPHRSQKEASPEVPEEEGENPVPITPLADVAASLTSKGKLLLLYMQWCFPAFGGAASMNGTAGSATSAVNAAIATVNVPSFFTADLENDATSTAAVHRSAAECATMLADVVAHTAQLLRRVQLLLSYCHAIRARSLTVLEGSSDAAVARLVTFMGSTKSADVEARVPTEHEKSFLKSEAPFVSRQ
ncbi:hypothetical protein ABB37_07813 [Leptomonas pyrrhocoris]|uniref:Uncharacterized protein n=1 Tax=Leptomonas pyrrhocoris TaxID=157538 RepID=A0A0N0DSU3_LEPPY|nr:hypothetical protein ABB37_07813 [Leptomonas pyrrhocoris]KPA76514.1 hypothetical protein ABB37_07813 [Leptomonas pyrrhocoris]|eukprot:XP_015654953.1 hypothetical protein ABB37_07813 [Leptomonas pyrrhocoris]